MKVLLLCHESLVPPTGVRGYSRRAPPEWRTEFDVLRALRTLGHEVRVLGSGFALEPLVAAVRAFRPAVVFNLMVEFHGRGEFDQHVASGLELLQVAYTGCRPRGLTLARDKALSKELLRARGLDVPRFQVFVRGSRTRREPALAFPLIVKSRTEEASLGIARGSLVTGEKALARAVRRIHEKVGSDAIVEEYLEGRELYSAVLGAARPRVFPTWELVFKHPGSHPRIATRAVKFSPPLQRRLGVVNRAARLPAALERRVHTLARATWNALSLSGYARIDLRLTPTGRLAVLEANPNPELARGEDFADAAKAAGIDHDALIASLLELARRGERR